VHALAGQPGPALDALAKALKAGYPPQFAQDDPDLKALSKDRRFEALMRDFRSPSSR